MKRQTNLEDLHAGFRFTLAEFVDRLAQAHLPFTIFELWRSPARQKYLYYKRKSTRSKPWRSMHQYGLAADFVLGTDVGGKVRRLNDVNGDPVGLWETSRDVILRAGPEPVSCYDAWMKYRRIAEEDCGLQVLYRKDGRPWDFPHVQLSGWPTRELRRGNYPANGGESWAENLEAAIIDYPRGAPPAPMLEDERPSLEG